MNGGMVAFSKMRSHFLEKKSAIVYEMKAWFPVLSLYDRMPKSVSIVWLQVRLGGKKVAIPKAIKFSRRTRGIGLHPQSKINEKPV
jgi:hypothetical protein